MSKPKPRKVSKLYHHIWVHHGLNERQIDDALENVPEGTLHRQLHSEKAMRGDAVTPHDIEDLDP